MIANRPPADGSVQAPAAPSGPNVFAAASNAFQTMTKTKYQHHDVENAAAGTYYFDCVGLADYFLGQGAPKALAALRAVEHIPVGYVPSPNHFAAYLRSLPAAGNGLWLPISHVLHIQPGDLIIMEKPSTPGAKFVGHAMIAASAPLQLAERTVALTVFDSTGRPHGSDDSRNWDIRTIPAKPGAGNGSGFGVGRIQVNVNGSGAPKRISWHVGGNPVPTAIVIARALQ